VTNGCARPYCQAEPVVRFDFDGIVLAFCAQHAEDKAGVEPRPDVRWLAHGWVICDLCFRVLPNRVAHQEHFNLQGRVCPPVAA
jgi:hypothetical protein